MVHAQLFPGEENSGRLVTQVRNTAGQLASELHADRILGDGPPGTGCPVIASVSGSDLLLLVTEPTVSGIHDMERVMALANSIDVGKVAGMKMCMLPTGGELFLQLSAHHVPPLPRHPVP